MTEGLQDFTSATVSAAEGVPQPRHAGHMRCVSVRWTHGLCAAEVADGATPYLTLGAKARLSLERSSSTAAASCHSAEAAAAATISEEPAEQPATEEAGSSCSDAAVTISEEPAEQPAAEEAPADFTQASGQSTCAAAPKGKAENDPYNSPADPPARVTIRVQRCASGDCLRNKHQAQEPGAARAMVSAALLSAASIKEAKAKAMSLSPRKRRPLAATPEASSPRRSPAGVSAGLAAVLRRFR